MSFLLMIFLTLVCLNDYYPEPPWPSGPDLPLLLTAAAELLVGLHAWWVAWRARKPLERDPSLRDALMTRYDRGRARHQVLQFVTYGVVLFVLGWGWALKTYWQHDNEALPGLELLLLLPFVVGQVLTWLVFFDADRAADQAAHQLMEADPLGPIWLGPRHEHAGSFGGRWTYVLFNLRQKLALVFLPVILLIIQKELGRLLPGSNTFSQPGLGLLGALALLGVFISMPLLIRFVLGLKPLPEGRLRDRLLASAKRLRFRCSDILLWNTRSGMANALVVGLIPWVRYVVFTDRLLEEFTEDEIEAVFGHEVGHIKHYHMLYYLVFLVSSMMVLGLVADHYLNHVLTSVGDALAGWWPEVFPADLGQALGPNGKLWLFPVVLLLLGYIFLVFGFLSRRCERQADVFGCRAVSCGDPNCVGHDEQTVLVERGRSICPTGVRTFIRALEKVARVNGISRGRPGFLQSWQHSTIARRVAFLHGLLLDQTAEPGFQRRLLLIKGGLLVALGGLLVRLVMLHGL